MADILITGGQGQVGLELARQVWPAGIRLYFPTRDELDIGSSASVETYFANRTFAAVINAAAYTAVDQAESEPDLAARVNAHGPALLAIATSTAGIPLIHISTDYVFDGAKAAPYLEDDPVAPLGVYGASKLAGEKAVLAGNPRSVVMRTAWVISAHRNNFLKTMLRAGATNPVLRVVNDQIGCPTSAQDIAWALRRIATRMIGDPAAPTGIFHFVNGGDASWYALAQAIFALSGGAGHATPHVQPIVSADYPTPTRRPANSRLDTTKIATQYGVHPRDWRAGLSDIIDELAPPKLERKRML